MKRVKINEGKIAIVKRLGDFNRILEVGEYWVRRNETVAQFDRSTIYNSEKDFDVLMQHDAFKSKVNVIDVADDEIAVIIKAKNVKLILTPGQYFYFKGVAELTVITVNLNDVESTSKLEKSIVTNPLLANYRIATVVQPYEVGLLFIDGTFIRKLEKGTYYFWKGAVSVEVHKADLRQIQLEISGQEMLTKDKAALRINFQASYKLVDVEKALIENKDFEKQLYACIQLGLREFIGKFTLDELLDTKEKVSESVLDYVEERATQLGVEVLNAGIRDVILPGEVRDIMNSVLVAQKTAEANTIARREETASTRSLLNTAKLMEENAMLFKLKEMEFVEKVANRIGEVTISNGGKVLDQLTSIFTK